MVIFVLLFLILKKNKILISSDIFATKPIFYKFTKNKCIISSLRSVICDIENKSEFENRNLEFPIYNEKQTNINDIHKNKPNKIMIYNLNNLKLINEYNIHNFA